MAYIYTILLALNKDVVTVCYKDSASPRREALIDEEEWKELFKVLKSFTF